MKHFLFQLVHDFFVRGSLHRCDYGAAPVVQFNEYQETSITPSIWLKNDVRLLEDRLGVGFFHYGPRLWMIGEIEPLQDLLQPSSRTDIINRILEEYPTLSIPKNTPCYRLRVNPEQPHLASEYDSPPAKFLGNGHLDSEGFPILYASQNLQVCMHECRISAEDEIYVATLILKKDLKLLDLTTLLPEECTEFESLDMAIHMLFLAGDHSYKVSRDLARAVQIQEYDGIIYPSYFSMLRTGGMPFETTYGLSHRRIPQLQETEKRKIIKNFALFGRPISELTVGVKSINRLILNSVQYDVSFGPVEH